MKTITIAQALGNVSWRKFCIALETNQNSLQSQYDLLKGAKEAWWMVDLDDFLSQNLDENEE